MADKAPNSRRWRAGAAGPEEGGPGSQLQKISDPPHSSGTRLACLNRERWRPTALPSQGPQMDTEAQLRKGPLHPCPGSRRGAAEGLFPCRNSSNREPFGDWESFTDAVCLAGCLVNFCRCHRAGHE